MPTVRSGRTCSPQPFTTGDFDVARTVRKMRSSPRCPAPTVGVPPEPGASPLTVVRQLRTPLRDATLHDEARLVDDATPSGDRRRHSRSSRSTASSMEDSPDCSSRRHPALALRRVALTLRLVAGPVDSRGRARSTARSRWRWRMAPPRPSPMSMSWLTILGWRDIPTSVQRAPTCFGNSVGPVRPNWPTATP